MAISPADAAAALADINRTEARGQDARTYRGSGAILILWGAIWFVAYTAAGLLPPQDWWMAWLPGDLIGFLGTALLYPAGGRGKSARKFWLVALAAVCFATALYITNPPRTLRQGELLPALLVAFLYILVGAVRLTRYAWIGGFLFVASLFGFFVLPQYFSFWLAIVGGGALAVSGIWLRSA